jgi:ribosome biogenesis GTPase
MKKRGGIETGPLGQAPPDSSLEKGLVVSHLGQGLAVERSDGAIILCHTRRRLGYAAVGDRVLWEPVEGNQGRVLEILPRKSLLARPGHNEKTRPVAANLDRIIVVIAPVPEPDWLLVDQFLAACEHRQLGAALIVNKIDLSAELAGLKTALADYQTAGYPVFFASTRHGTGLTELRAALAGRCSMLAGQSGVGKSSLTNGLLPDKRLRVRELSEKSGLGRHTTTAATLYHLAGGGDLIDSPGVAVFGLADMSGKDVAEGFPEFRPWLAGCQFNDCRHGNDKNCSVRMAVEAGKISAARYQRYLKLLARISHTPS